MDRELSESIKNLDEDSNIKKGMQEILDKLEERANNVLAAERAVSEAKQENILQKVRLGNERRQIKELAVIEYKSAVELAKEELKNALLEAKKQAYNLFVLGVKHTILDIDLQDVIRQVAHVIGPQECYEAFADAGFEDEIIIRLGNY